MVSLKQQVAVSALFLVLFFGLFAAGFIVGKASGEKRTQQEAIKNENGYYEVDQKTGAVRFRWREFPPRTVIMRHGGRIEVPNE